MRNYRPRWEDGKGRAHDGRSCEGGGNLESRFRSSTVSRDNGAPSEDLKTFTQPSDRYSACASLVGGTTGVHGIVGFPAIKYHGLGDSRNHRAVLLSMAAW